MAGHRGAWVWVVAVGLCGLVFAGCGGEPAQTTSEAPRQQAAYDAGKFDAAKQACHEGVAALQKAPKRQREPAARDTVARCVGPACNHRIEMTNEQWGERVAGFAEAHPETIRGMSPLRLLCPKCKNPKYTLVKAMTCPKCGEMFVSPDQLARARRACGFEATPHRGPILCPACGVDIIEYWRQNRGKALRR